MGIFSYIPPLTEAQRIRALRIVIIAAGAISAVCAVPAVGMPEYVQIVAGLLATGAASVLGMPIAEALRRALLTPTDENVDKMVAMQAEIEALRETLHTAAQFGPYGPAATAPAVPAPQDEGER